MRFIKSYHKLRNPQIFQGTLNKKNYFEGWYFKLVDDTFNNIFAIIPTIALNKSKNQKLSIIQFFDAKNGKIFNFKYPLEEFWTSNYEFKIKIGKNYFSLNKVDININQEEQSIIGKLQFENLTPIPNSLLFPGAMGPFSYLPFMETYHGILSMNHKIKGTLKYNDQIIEFPKNSKGYIEKDWGKSFPRGWIWMQTNHFNKKNCSFMLSIAEIPYLGQKFIGFLSYLWINGKIYNFSTYNFSKLRFLNANSSSAQIVIENRDHILIVNAKQGKTTSLIAPDMGEMSSRSIESINAKIRVSLFENSSKKRIGKKIFSDIGANGGLELMNTQLLTTIYS